LVLVAHTVALGDDESAETIRIIVSPAGQPKREMAL
jgi:hypothetical protein